MKKPGLIFLAVSLILINACGKVTATKALTAAGPTSATGPMSETAALNILSEVPVDTVVAARSNGKPKVSAAELSALIQQLIREGKVKLPAGVVVKTATGGIDLSQLTNVFTALQSGGIGSLFQLSSALLAMNNGSTSATGGGLAGIVAILQAVAPIIAVIAPQFAPIIAALMTILPLVITFINLFKKPAATVTFFFEPVAV